MLLRAGLPKLVEVRRQKQRLQDTIAQISKGFVRGHQDLGQSGLRT